MKPLPRHAASFLAPLAVAAGACQDHPAAPPDGALPSRAIVATAAELALARGGVTDVKGRVLPSLLALERLANEAELGVQLEEIASALERGDARALERGIARAERLLGRLESKDDGSGASDIEAIRIALDEAKRLLKAEDVTTQANTSTEDRTKS